MTTTTSGSTRVDGPRPKPAKRSTDRAKAERRLGLKLAAPAAILMVSVTAFPILYAIWLSLQRYDLRSPDENAFIGLGNYALILTSSAWWTAVLSTTLITVVSVVLELVIGLAFALVMHRAIFGRRTVRTAILVPYGIITVISAYAFAFAVAPDTGFLGFLPGTPDPLSSTSGSFATIILTEVWKTTPFMSLLLLAGLATVPEELQEAAKVDGATAWQRLRYITVPMMRNIISITVLFSLIVTFANYDIVRVLTNGGPRDLTHVFATYAFQVGILSGNVPRGAAVSLFMFPLLAIFAFFVLRGVTRRNKEQM